MYIYIYTLSYFLGFFVRWHINLYSYLPTPPLGQDMTQSQFYKWSLTGLNSEFSFS